VKLLLDTDILLDVALARPRFVAESAAAIEWCQANPGSAFVAWHTVSNLYYLLRAAGSDRKAREFISDLIRFAEVISGTTDTVHRALALRMKDFEDALQAAAAVTARAELIITRNVSDYRHSTVPAARPADFLARLAAK
jgi:predicted nucleic acid-binding protein